MARRFAYLLVWLSLTQEVEGEIFAGLWRTPLTAVDTFLFRGAPIVHIFPWDALVLGTLALTWSQSRKNRVVPLLKSMRVTFAFIALVWLWGVVVNNGSAYQTIFQLHSFVVGLFTAYMLMATCRTVAHIAGLGKVVVWATIYRSILLLVFYFAVAQYQSPPLATLTTHSDSALFASGLLILVIDAFERRSPKSILWALFGLIVVGSAIQLNNRRIAWLGVVVGLVFLYVTMPKDRVKRRIRTVLIALAPLFAVYVAVGWGHPTGIFKPVGSISTMFGSNQDTSSMMRDIENYNLMQTLKTNGFLGVGLGNEYREIISALNIGQLFPQYRYMPHNSYLGLLAFSGWIGFTGITQLLIVMAFFLARAHGVARTPATRTAALGSLVNLVMFLLLAWGDVGLQGIPENTLLACSLAVAGRLPPLVGVWPWPDGKSVKIGNHVQ
jgi:hypothetical protein